MNTATGLIHTWALLFSWYNDNIKYLWQRQNKPLGIKYLLSKTPLFPVITVALRNVGATRLKEPGFLEESIKDR